MGLIPTTIPNSICATILVCILNQPFKQTKWAVHVYFPSVARLHTRLIDFIRSRTFYLRLLVNCWEYLSTSSLSYAMFTLSQADTSHRSISWYNHSIRECVLVTGADLKTVSLYYHSETYDGWSYTTYYKHYSSSVHSLLRRYGDSAGSTSLLFKFIFSSVFLYLPVLSCNSILFSYFIVSNFILYYIVGYRVQQSVMSTWSLLYRSIKLHSKYIPILFK